jgi:SMI1/KNR4 family protein SUKH-1
MSDLDELTSRVPPPEDPPPAVDWDAAHAALGVELPADYRALVERYGGGSIAGLRLLVPGHPNRYVDLLRQVDPQRWALQQLIDQGIEQPYAPGELLPWGIDDAGNCVWWLMDEGWPVVANEARGEDWQRYDGGAVAFLVAILAGREPTDFLVIEGDDFERYAYEPESGP